MSTGASMNRGGSKQDYETPKEFMNAIERRFGPIAWDLAAAHGQQKAPRFIAPPGSGHVHEDFFSDAALRARGLCWLNPPFGAVAKWAARCAEITTQERQILMLAPASVSTDYFAEHIFPHSLVLAIRPRIAFVGEKQGFPKDLMLACYGFGVHGFDLWQWKRRDESAEPLRDLRR